MEGSNAPEGKRADVMSVASRKEVVMEKSDLLTYYSHSELINLLKEGSSNSHELLSYLTEN